jgi:hypothetical protein
MRASPVPVGSAGLCGLVLAGLSAILAAAPPPGFEAFEPVTRTAYVTVTDGNGAPVPDLTPADFTVKEGGKEREVVKATPATARMRVSVMTEERLLGDGSIRLGIFEFMKRIQPTSEIGFFAIGLRNQTIVNYTTDLNAIVSAINGLSLNPPPQSNLTEGILDVSKAIQRDRPERPVIVVVALSGGQAGGASSNEVLNQLRQSGAVMHSVTVATNSAQDPLGSLGDASNREQVLGDGAKQSGGRRIEITATVHVAKALHQIANELSAQYVLQYTLPDGVKPDRRLSVSLKRRGVSVRAPSLIPDR